MAARVSARLSHGAGRQFGLTVGAGFTALAFVARWRGHPMSSAVLMVVGIGLIAAGVVAPTRLALARVAWMRLGGAIARVTTPLVMAVIYYGLLTPLGVVLRAAGRRPLMRDSSATTYWVPHRSPAEGHGGMERQF